LFDFSKSSDLDLMMAQFPLIWGYIELAIYLLLLLLIGYINFKIKNHKEYYIINEENKAAYELNRFAIKNI
jgi:hypothetical protein